MSARGNWRVRPCGADVGVSELASSLGQDVYVDVNGWHLFLKEMKFHIPLVGPPHPPHR